MFRLVQFLSLGLGLSILAVGCAPPGESGIRSNKRLGQLSAEERNQLCEWRVSLVKKVAGTECKGDDDDDGYTVEQEKQGKCEGELISIASKVDKNPECDSSVDDFEKCVTDFVKRPCKESKMCEVIRGRQKPCLE